MSAIVLEFSPHPFRIFLTPKIVVLGLRSMFVAWFSLSTLVPADGPAAYPIPVQNIKPLLTVSFTSGDISLMSNYDDLSPTVIRSGLKGTEHI